MINKYIEYKIHLKEYIKYTLESREFIKRLNGKLEENLCPICGINDYKDVFKTLAYEFVKCNNCELVYPKKLFKQEVFDEFYKEDEGQNKIWKSEYETLMLKKFKKELSEQSYVKIIKKYSLKKNKYLDIGCGFGESLYHLKHYFKSVEGIELNKYTSKMGSFLFNTKIYNKTLAKAKLKKGTYDCISLLNVIEHLYDLDIFYEINKLLKKGGIVYIECPFMDSLSMELFREKHNAVDNFEHINMFNIKSFEKLAKKYGFEVVNTTTDETLDIQLNDILMANSKNFIHRFNDIPFINPLNVFLYLLSNTVCSKTKLLSKYLGGSYIQVVLRKK